MKIQKITKNTGQVQFFLTLPLALVRAMNWDKGTELKFSVVGKNKLELVRE